MLSYCLDCGCKMSSGICSNCHEELYIIENQSEFITHPLSDEFTDNVAIQRKQVNLRIRESG